jgi:exonuclease VII small subunit
MREANLKTRQVQAKEEYEMAVKMVDHCRSQLANAKQQVGPN